MRKFLLIYKIVAIGFLLSAALPVFYTLTFVLLNGNGWDKIAFGDFLLLVKSILLSATVALGATFAGGILGFVLFKTRWKRYDFLKIIFLIPLFISPYILAVAWRDFFNIIFSRTDFIYSVAGMVWVLITVFTPLAMLMVGSAFANINAHLEECGLLMVNQKKVLLKIVLPLLKPAVLSSFALIFIFAVSNFSVPAFFGVKVFTTEIFTQFSAFYNHDLAIIKSLLLTVICALLLLSEYKYLSDAPFFSLAGKGLKTKVYNDEKLKRYGAIFLSFWFVVTIIVPFAVLFWQTWHGGRVYWLKAWQLLIPTFKDSFSLAFFSSLIVVFTGVVIAYFSVWLKYNTKFITGLLLLVFVIPSTVYGISLIRFYNVPLLNIIYSGLLIIVIAFWGKFSFVSVKIITNAIKQLPESMHDAARIAGAGEFTIFSKILFPLMLPAIFAVFIIVFVFSLGEMGTVIMIYPPGIELMPVKVFTIMANVPQSLTGAMSLVVFLVTLMVVAFLFLVYKLFISKDYRANG